MHSNINFSQEKCPLVIVIGMTSVVYVLAVSFKKY